jgi:hypothetical protein
LLERQRHYLPFLVVERLREPLRRLRIDNNGSELASFYSPLPLFKFRSAFYLKRGETPTMDTMVTMTRHLCKDTDKNTIVITTGLGPQRQAQGRWL